MTVRMVGAWCRRCGIRPARDRKELCAACGLLVQAFPRAQSDTPRVMSVTDPGWEREFARWREGTA